MRTLNFIRQGLPFTILIVLKLVYSEIEIHFFFQKTLVVKRSFIVRKYWQIGV